MTRDEAIKVVQWRLHAMDQDKAPRIVDEYVALGMLKLEEPDNANVTFLNVVKSIEGKNRTPSRIFAALTGAGLKIVVAK